MSEQQNEITVEIAVNINGKSRTYPATTTTPGDPPILNSVAS